MMFPEHPDGRKRSVPSREPGKPSWVHKVFAHTKNNLTLKERRSVPMGAVSGINTSRKSHRFAHGSLAGVEIELRHWKKELSWLQTSRKKIPDREARIQQANEAIARYENRLSPAQKYVLETNDSQRREDRSEHSFA